MFVRIQNIRTTNETQMVYGSFFSPEANWATFYIITDLVTKIEKHTKNIKQFSSEEAFESVSVSLKWLNNSSLFLFWGDRSKTLPEKNKKSATFLSKFKSWTPMTSDDKQFTVWRMRRKMRDVEWTALISISIIHLLLLLSIDEVNKRKWTGTNNGPKNSIRSASNSCDSKLDERYSFGTTNVFLLNKISFP